MKKILYTLLFVLISYSLKSQDGTTSYLKDDWIEPVDMEIDFIHLKAELKIDPYKPLVEGLAIITFKPFNSYTDSIDLYMPGLKINSISLDGINLEYETIGNNIRVFINQKLKKSDEYNLYVDYAGFHEDGLYLTGWNDPKGLMRKQVWAHSPAGWLPIITQKHDLFTTELLVTFDGRYKVFSNGDRLAIKDNGNGTKTWHYKMSKPHVVYLICLVIGDYEFKTSKTKRGVPVELWYYPDMPDRFAVTYLHSEYMIDFFEQEIGVNYPYSVYRQAPLADYLYGGMETTTATVFGDYMYIDGRAWWMRNYVNVNSHELNHQWFGNYISHLNNRHTWLTESFATHYAKIFEKDINGEDYFQWERDKELIRTFNAAKSNNNPVAHSHAGTDRWYPKGSLVLDMMRTVLGNDDFRAAIKYYTEKNALQVTETYDLLKAIREATGQSIDWFFEQWIYRGGEPHYQVSYESVTDQYKENYVVFTVKQIHPVSSLIKYFKMPIEFEVHYTDGSVDSQTHWVEGETTIVKMLNLSGKTVDFAVFDPNRKIIKKLNFKRSFRELSAQVLKSKNMIDRYDALLEIKDKANDVKRELLRNVFEKETFHLTKAEIIAQLATDSLNYDIMFKALNDKDALVRKAVLDNLKTVPFSLESEYRKILKDSSYTNVELALDILAKNFPENIDAYLNITKNETGWRGNNIKMKWLEIAIQSGKKNYFKDLIEYTSLSYDFETRINAFNILKSFNYCDDNVINNAFQAMAYWHFKLRDAAKSYIQYFSQQTNYYNDLQRLLKISKLDDNKKERINKLLEK